MDKAITFEKAHFVSAEFKIARGGVATYMHAIARLSRLAARAMGAEWTIYDQDSTPKAGCKKWELDYEIRNADSAFDLTTVGKSPFHLALRCPLIDRFIIVKIGEGKRKAKSTYLAAKFRMLVDGREQELLEFLKKVGGGEGKLVLASREEQLALQDQAKAEGPAKSNSELFGQPRPQIVPEMAPAKEGLAVKVTGPNGEVAFDGTATEFHEAVEALGRGDDSPLPASGVVSVKTPATDWPQPNKNGVYDRRDPRVIRIFPMAKDGSRKAIFMTEGTDAEVRVLQIGLDEWINGLTLVCCGAVLEVPLLCEDVENHGCYPNQVEAAVAAYNRMDDFARDHAQRASNRDAKKWNRILDWLNTLLVEGELWIGDHAAPADQLPADPEFEEEPTEALEPIRVVYDEEIKAKSDWYTRVRVVAMEDGYNYAWWVRLGKAKTPLFSDQGEDFVDVPSEEAIRLGLDAVMKSVRLQLRTAPDDQVQKLKTPGARVVAWAHERHSEQPQETVQ